MQKKFKWILSSLCSFMLLVSLSVTGYAKTQADYEQYKDKMIKEPSLIRFYTFEKGTGDEVTNHVDIDRSQRAVTGGPLGSLTIQRTKGSGHALSLDPKFGPPPTWSHGRWSWKSAVLSGAETSTLPWQASKLYRTGITGVEFAKGGTLSGWFRIHEVDKNNASCNLIRLGNGYASGFTLEYSKVHWSPEDRLEFRLGAQGEAARVVLTAKPCVPGVWHHFAVTFDDQIARMYFDGKMVEEKPSTGPVIPTKYENMPMIGPFYEYNSPSRFGEFLMLAHNPAKSNGAAIARYDIGELAIYNRALPAAKIIEQYQAGQPDAAVEQQLDQYHQMKQRQQKLDAITIDLPSQTDGYFRVNESFTTRIQMPEDSSLTGKLTAEFILETLEGKPVQSVKQTLVPGKEIAQTFALDQCDVYYLDVIIRNEDGELLKRLPNKQGLGVVAPKPAALTDHNPLAFWADVEDRFYFDVPTRRMNYTPSRDIKPGESDTMAMERFMEKYNEYVQRVPNFRAYVWFYCNHDNSKKTSENNQRIFSEAIKLFKPLNVFALEVTSEPHAKDIKGYVSLLKTVYDAVKSEKPDMLIVPPGAAPPSIPMIANILKEGGINYVDGVSYHPYRANPIGTYLWESSTARLKKVIAQYPDKHLKMWNTECTIGQLPRINGRPMTRSDGFAARFKSSESYGLQFFPFFVPRYPEDEGAALQCHGILIDLLQGYELYTIHTTPNNEGQPSYKGLAITALAGQVLNKFKSISRLPMSIAENMCMMIKDVDGKTTAAIFSLNQSTVNFKVQPNKTYKTMDMLGNFGSITASNAGLITLPIGLKPTYIFDVPTDMQQVVPLLVESPDVLPEHRVLEGRVTVKNPFDGPLIGTLVAKPLAGTSIVLDQTDVSLKPGQSKVVDVTLTADFLKRRSYLLSVDLQDNKGNVIASAQSIFKSKGVIQLIPQATQTITVDGNDDEWKNIKGVVCDDVDSVVHGKPNYAEVWMPQWMSKEDLSLNLKLAWRRDGLYFMLKVTDDQVIPAPEGAHAFRYDCLELFFDGRNHSQRGTTISVGADQAVITPNDKPQAQPCKFWFARKEKDEVSVDLQTVSRKTDDGYLIEGKLVPKSWLDFKLLPGSQFMMDFLIDDTDSTELKWLRKTVMAVHGTYNNYVNPDLWGRYELEAGQ
jgi:hypothetical protein